jgi:hypothetical protein
VSDDATSGGQSTRAWLARLGLALALGAGAGALAYLAARGVAGALLLFQQRELLGQVVGAIGSLEGPPPADLRATRLQIEALDALYMRRSLIVGIAAGAISAVAYYLRLERRAI